MKRLITQKFKYIPSHYLFQYEKETYIKRDDGLVINTGSRSVEDWQKWEYDNDVLVWIDPTSILFQVLGPDVKLHQISSDADVFDLEGLDEPYGELMWVNGVWHWNHIVFLSSQVIHINQVLRTIYIEV